MLQNVIPGIKSYNFFGFLSVDLKCHEWKSLIASSGMLFDSFA